MNWDSHTIQLRIILAITLLVLAAGLIARIYNLDMDPPSQVGEYSQDLTTDPPHLTSFAADYVKFGESEPYPFPKWHVFQVSLVSGIAYALFLTFGVSRALSNLAGAIPATLGIFFFVFAIMADAAGRRRMLFAAFTAAVFLGINFALVIYNRAPFMESGLILYFGLITFLYLKFGDRVKNLIIIGCLVSLAFLTGKAFAVSIGAAIFFTIILSDTAQKTKKVVIFTVTVLVSGAAFLYLLYGDAINAYYAYLYEQSYSSHGSLWIIESIKRFGARIIIYGTQTRLFADTPFFALSIYLTLITLVLIPFRRWQSLRQNRMLLFSLCWLVTLLVLLIPPNYRPLRYSILLYFPLALTVASLFSVRADEKSDFGIGQLLTSFFLLLIINWYFMTHAALDFFYYERYKVVGFTIMVRAFWPALILAIILSLAFIRRKLVRHIFVTQIAIIILAIASLYFQGAKFIAYASQPCYSIRDASQDLAHILAPGAVLTGPYAPVLTLDNKLHHFIYAFGLAQPDFNIFTSFPVTHMAVDKAGLDASIDDFPELKDAISVTDYFLRNREMMVLRVSQLSKNPVALAYEPSDYEKAMFDLILGKYDSALVYNSGQYRLYPKNRSVMIQRALIMSQLDERDELIKLLDDMNRYFPDDSAVQYFYHEQLKALQPHTP